MDNQSFYMKECLRLAKKGLGKVSPNPMVGCVIVYNEKIIGTGYHKSFGKNHAEVNAIQCVKDKSLLKKSTLYVNLEPCSHYGKTPPCSDLIIKSGINKVIIGCIDPFKKVLGKGVEKLRENGIKVSVGILKKECEFLNRRFFTYHTKKRPYIILKWAESKDRFIAPINQSKPFWMTSKESKRIVHKWRSEEDAILVGRVTVQKDNPLLTNRKTVGKNPLRIVIDKDLKLDYKSNIYNKDARTLIITSKKSFASFDSNIEFICLKFKHLIKELVSFLHEKGIQSVIIEGGRETLQSFIDESIYDEVRRFVVSNRINDGVKAPILEYDKLENLVNNHIEGDLLEKYIRKPF